MNEPLETTLKDRRISRAQSAQAPLLPELRGHRAAWAGVETPELLARGCDQRGVLERLASKGVRHVIVPLNGAGEDSCLFARKLVPNLTHPFADGKVVFDVERRDEGTFTRLKFLLEAAASTGMLLGLSLFDARGGPASGPFRHNGNIQSLEFSDGLGAGGAGGERWRAVLGAAADWVCSAARGFRGVWIEVFRHAPEAAAALERVLSTRIAETFGRHGEDLSPARLGPWIAVRRTHPLADKHGQQTAPFDILDAGSAAPGARFFDVLEQAEGAAGIPEGERFFGRRSPRRPVLLRCGEGVLDGTKSDWLWRAFFRGYWPVIAARVAGGGDTRLFDTLCAVAKFGVAWGGRRRLRPCPEILVPELIGGRLDSCFAAQDGAGRYFVYFCEAPGRGLPLALPAGHYRFYWIDPAAGRVVDRGDSAEDGGRTGIPGCGDAQALVLVVEQDESPDTLSVW